MTSTSFHRRELLGVTSAAAAGLALPWSVRADDAPATPKTPMPPVEAYAGSPAIDEIALSPDASHIGYVTQRGDQKVLVSYDMATATAKSFALGPAKIRDLFWVDNSRVLLTNSVTTALNGFAGDKHEFRLARLIDVNDTKIRTLFERMDGFYSIVMGNIGRIKTAKGYRVTASNYNMSSNHLCLYSFGVDGGFNHLIHEGGYETERWVLTPDGFPLAYYDFDDSRKEWELFYNIGKEGNSRFRSIYKVKEGPWPSLEGLGRDGTSVVIYVERPSDAAGPEGDEADSGNTDSGETAVRAGDYYEISAEGVLSEPLDRSGDGRERSPLFHPTTRRLAGFARHDDWFSYDYFDPLMKKLADAVGQVVGADYRVSIADFAEDPRKMIIYGEGPQDAGSYFYSDFSTGAVEYIASNYDIEAEWITQKQPIDYKAADGLDIHAYLTLPPFKTAKNLPLVVLPHGGPQSRDYLGFDWQVQVLASRGYAVLQPNFRGSEGYGQAFILAGHGEWGRKMQTDLSDGVRFLTAKGTIDPKRVAILGASYGGYAALAGATLDPGVYRCAVSIAGVSDVKAMIDFETDNSAQSRFSERVLYWKRFMGDKSGWDAISPAKQAARAACPILLIHGTDDTVVSIDQSRRMEKALKAAGKPVEFVTYKGQDHWETIGSSRVEMMKVALAFLDKHNPA